jgi:hypothetical protein
MLTLKEYYNTPSLFFLGLIKRFNYLFPDRYYLKLLYRLELGRSLDLEHPKRYTEKLQWLKLHDRNPLYTQLVDKQSVKDYVSKYLGDEFIIPTLGVWDSFDEIDWDRLPDKFVLKTTHGGGGSGVVICEEKKLFDKDRAKVILTRSLKQSIYPTLREWPYKDVPHRIIAEQLLDKDPVYNDVPDYKFYCFHGVPKVLLIASNRYTTHNFDYYDMDFRPLGITSNMGSNSSLRRIIPTCFDEMKRVAAILSQGFPHVRVDLYSSNNRVYFGELTFYDSSGFDNMSSDRVDLEWGSWIHLPDLSSK